MEAILFILVAVLGAAMAAAVGTYYLSHNALVKAHAMDSEFISLLLSLCSFGIVISVVYFTVLNNIISKW